MKYDLSNELDLKKAKVYFARLQVQQRKVELKEIKKPKNLKPQKYLRVCIKAYAEHFDYTTKEAEVRLKRKAPGMIYTKHGEKFLRPIEDLTDTQLSDFIDFVRSEANELGLYIETADEHLANFW